MSYDDYIVPERHAAKSQVQAVLDQMIILRHDLNTAITQVEKAISVLKSPESAVFINTLDRFED